MHVLSDCVNFCCHNKLLIGKQSDSEMTLVCRERGTHDKSVRKYTKKLRDEGSEIFLRSAFPKVQIEVNREGNIKIDTIMEGFSTKVKLPEPKNRRRMSRASDLGAPVRGASLIGLFNKDGKEMSPPSSSPTANAGPFSNSIQRTISDSQSSERAGDSPGGGSDPVTPGLGTIGSKQSDPNNAGQ
jgi:hypothetical protein